MKICYFFSIIIEIKTYILLNKNKTHLKKYKKHKIEKFSKHYL